MNNNKLNLFNEFPPVSEKEWTEQVIKDLKGREFQKLIWKTYEEIDVPPFYTEEDIKQLQNQTGSLPGEFPFVRGASSNSNDWKINQKISHKDINQANKLALKSLNGGADSLTFKCELDNSEYDGIPIQNVDQMTRLLNEIDIETTAINFDSGTSSIGILSLYINEAKRRGIKLNKLFGSVNLDPLKDLAINGKFTGQENLLFAGLSELVSYLNTNMPLFKGLKIHSSQFHNSGASITQELAYTLSAGVEYLDRLTETGLTIDHISKQMIFSFSIGSNYFMEISKLRAARLLWAQIVKQYQPVNEASMIMNIETTNSSWNKTIYDPFVNLLRGTVETMSGAIGGSNAITVRPFDSEYKNPDEFSLRMSRNTQLILRNESYLERIADPSAGSYYIESLTHSIARESWKLFQSVESEGGLVESLKSGSVQDAIGETRNSRDMNIALRKDTFLGVNQYPNSTEQMLSKIEDNLPETNIQKSGKSLNPDQKLSIKFAVEYFSGDRTYLGDLLFTPSEEEDLQIDPLIPYRGAQIFEELRITTETHARDTGQIPVIFLLTIGNASMRSTRASFAENFFGSAGYKIINNIGFDNPEVGVKKAVEHNADVVVICSSDDEYPEFAPKITKGLKELNSDIKIVIAGNPKDHVEKLKNSGVDDFIHVRSNAIEILTKYQKILGISK